MIRCEGKVIFVFPKFCRDRSSVVAVEFAVSGFAFFFILFALLNLGYAGFILGGLQNGVEDAAREAAVQTSATLAQNGSPSACTTSTQIRDFFNAVANPPLPSATGSTTDGTPVVSSFWTNQGQFSGGVPGTYITVTATYKWSPIGLPLSAFSGFNFGYSSSDLVTGSLTEATACS